MKKYDNYKDSGVEWIGKIPEHWDVKKLKFISKICNGQDQKAVIDDNGIYPIYGSGGIFGKAKSFLFDQPSVLLGRKGTIDKPQYVVEPFWTVDTSYYTKIKDGFSTRLFYYLCTTINFELYKYGSAIPSMTQGHLNEIKFSIPNTLDEQTAIANYLDRKTTQIDTLITKKEQFISLLQEERTAVINQAVTKGLDPKVKMKDSGIEWLGEIPEHWKLMRVGSLSQCITGFAFKSDNFSFENGIKIVRGDNVTENSLRWGDKTRYWNEYSEVLDRFQLQKNDIVIGMDGSKVGKNYAYVEEKDLPLLLVQRVARIRSNSELIAKWIHFNIGTYNFKYYINLSKTDPAIPHITLKNITSYPICIPDINELNLIIEKLNSKLEKLDETLKKSKQEIELLKEYKTALISEVVTGKVDVRDVILN